METKCKTASILVIDDEKGLRDMLVFSLSAQGHRVVPASGGREGLAAAGRQDFEVVLCDFSMPGMDGLATLKALKELQPGITVIMMTGYGTPDGASEAERLGAFDTIPKPFELKELNVLVAWAVGCRE